VLRLLYLPIHLIISVTQTYIDLLIFELLKFQNSNKNLNQNKEVIFII